MEKIVAIGIQDFEQLRRYDAFYVDKTDFIRKPVRVVLAKP